jgi:AraC-like DNA-binding protein
MSAPLQHPLRAWLQQSASPADTARVLADVLPVQRLEAVGPPSSWWHLDGNQKVGSLPMAASVGSPLVLEAGEHRQHWLLLQHDGSASLQQGRQSQHLQNGDAVILPGLPWTLHTLESSCTVVGFDAIELLAAARKLGGPRWQTPSPRHNPLRAICSLGGPQDSPSAVLLGMLNRLLISWHEVAQLREELLELLLLQQQLYRLLALLVFEELRQGDEGETAAAGSTDPRLESLLDFIGLHLDQPLTLQQLEEQSNYSRRTLHYLFHQRFGCSPMQWIRQLRMSQALERLSHPAVGDTVKSVAAECGYRSLSQFGLDFQRAHSRRPSELLRAGRSPSA